MWKKLIFLFLVIGLLVFLIGCGGGGNPIVPPGDETTTDEEFNDIINIGENAIDKFEEYCNSIGEEQAYQATVDFLEQQNGVKKAGIGEDGTTIWYEHENGYLIGILSTEEDEKANEKGIELPFDQSKVVPSAEKALILNPGFNPLGTLKAQNIKEKLNSFYGGYVYKSGSNVSIELMKELYQYSVIYIITHGGIIKDNECFCLKIEATSAIKDQYDYYFKNQYLVTGLVRGLVGAKPYVMITPSFIKDYNSGTFPDSLICVDACFSLKNETMAEAFKGKGAYTYCGYTTTMRFIYNTPVDFFENLISEEMNVEDAIDNLSNNNFKYYPEDHGDLYLVDNHPPVITSTPVTSATKDELYSYDVNATDSDGDTLTYSLTTKPSGMSINSSTGLIAWTPTTSGDYNVTVKASDGELFDTQSFTVTVEENGTYALHDIGPAEGYIFYDKGYYSSGWRYLEAAPVSTEWTDKQWGSGAASYNGTLIGGTETDIGTGQSNTTKIATYLNSQGETGYAAQLCDALVYGGYSDWFLPSKDELNLMYTNLKVYGVGGFVNDWYWSSSEGDANYAWIQSFQSGIPSTFNKESFLARIRAVRAF